MNQPCPEDNSHSSNALMTHNKQLARSSKRSGPWLVRRSRLIYLRLIRLRGKPRAIATGLAVGVFAGLFPFLGMQSIMGICLAAIFRGSKVAAVAATWISNPLTYVPIFIFNYKVGKLILGVENTVPLPTDVESLASFRELGFTFAATLLTGCCVVGAIAAFVTYFYSLAILERIRENKKRKLKR